MKQKSAPGKTPLLIAPSLALLAWLLPPLSSPVSAATIVELEVKDGIGVATADYVISGIEYAEETDAELIIIDMDTPGGLMKPMHDIVKAILALPCRSLPMSHRPAHVPTAPGPTSCWPVTWRP